MNTTHFQYCQKLVVMKNSYSEVLLCKRKGEQDYDGIYSFPGGKMETTDDGIIDGMKREKDEELGENVKLSVHYEFSTNSFFRKKDGNAMILPHYLCEYQGGEIELNPGEYESYTRVPLEELASFEPKIENITEIVDLLLTIKDKSKTSTI